MQPVYLEDQIAEFEIVQYMDDCDEVLNVLSDKASIKTKYLSNDLLPVR